MGGRRGALWWRYSEGVVDVARIAFVLSVAVCCFSSKATALDIKISDEELVRVPVSDLPGVTSDPIERTPSRNEVEMVGLIFTSSVNLSKLSSAYRDMFNVLSQMFICGMKNEYRMTGHIFVHGGPEGYIALMPSSLARLPFQREDGGVQLGWPVALVQEHGICFQVVAGSMLGFRIESNTVRLPGDGRGVLW